MTKEETISNLKAYLNGDTAIGNIIPLRPILESAIKYLSEPSLPSNLDEAAEEYGRDTFINECMENGACDDHDLSDAFKAGAEWMAEQGVSMSITDETEWADVDSFVHKNVSGNVILQIRKNAE